VELGRRALPDDERAFHGARVTDTYDIPPAEGSFGVSFWLSATSAGTAVDEAIRLVQRACHAVIGRELVLWDIRLLPLDAVIGMDQTLPPDSSVIPMPPRRRTILSRRRGRS
jgi:hypothetical protein